MQSNVHFLNFIDFTKPSIEAALNAHFKRESALKTRTHSHRDVTEELALLAGRGGKRLRPLMCLLVYAAYDGMNESAAMNAAVSLELLHTFLLIHDDIIDRDLERWAGPNITGVYFEKFSQTMEPCEALHMAESWALLAGDICLNLAYSTLTDTDFPPKTVLAALKLMQSVTASVIGGELTDTANSFKNMESTEQDILAMYKQKTASYSFCLPLQMGALLAGAPKSEQQVLEQIGNHLGIAYQLQDDLLGMFGDESKTGKPVASDLREGKRTVLILKTLELANDTDRALVQSALGNKLIEPSELQKVQAIIKQSGAEQYTMDLAKTQSEKALKLIHKTTMDQLGKDRLTDLIHSLTDRQK